MINKLCLSYENQINFNHFMFSGLTLFFFEYDRNKVMGNEPSP